MRQQSIAGVSDDALYRTAGARLIQGNSVRLLKDATENYPAWIAAIASAEKWIHLESYIIHDDPTGRQFADLLCAKAQQGVKVRVLYDWVGALGNTSWRFWQRLLARGVDVRCFNPPRFDSPFGWMSRDHRKVLSVDGRSAYVSGLCVGQRWIGEPERRLDPWRDTGVEIAGPALIPIELAFSETWALTGEPLPPREYRPDRMASQEAGDIALRIVATAPNIGGVYRFDQLIATLARQSIWLSDAYFVGTSSYVQALRAAARSGVDVRLLVPGVNDVPVMRAVSRAGLRPLLEAGIRVFEWNGSMMHAKTAVADGQWARVGSTNLNLLSWMGNWELDVIVEDRDFAGQMESMFLDDISHATEIVIDATRRRTTRTTKSSSHRRKGGSAGRTAAGVVRLSNALGAALSNRRELGPAEAVVMMWGAALLTMVGLISAYFPRAAAVPIAVVCLWVAVSFGLRAFKLRRQRSPVSKRRR